MKQLFRIWLKGYGEDQYETVLAKSFTAVEAHYFLNHAADRIVKIERLETVTEIN